MTYGRPDLAVKIGLKGQRGYTMKDIGFLDQRISQLEYYTVLNALTQDTQSLSITNDETGLERFKNGIFVDPFNDSSLMRTDDPELSVGYSARNSLARPNFSEIFNDYSLDIDSSSNVQATNKLLTLSYTSEFLDGNEVATEFVNCTGNYYKFNGTATLYPDHYMAVDRNNAVPQNITIDNTIGFNALIATGKYKNIDITQGNPVVVGTTTTLTSGGKNIKTDYTRTDTKTITDIAVTQSQTSTFVNDNVVNVSELPFITSIELAFVARGLRPNTRFYPFFDKIDVSAYCAPAEYRDPNLILPLVYTEGQRILQRTGNYGNNLVSDSNGQLLVIFKIPSNTFKVGERIFTVMDVSDIDWTLGITSQASATFIGSTLGLTKQTSTFNIINPTVISPTVMTVTTDPISWSNTVYIADPPRQSNDYGSGGRSTDNTSPSGGSKDTGGGSGSGGTRSGGGSWPAGGGSSGGTGASVRAGDTPGFGTGGTSTIGGGGGYGSRSAPGDCHVAWAKVLMADGTLKEIQHIQVGDLVRGATSINEVTRMLTPNLDSRLVSFNNIDFFVSETHPLLTDRGWGAFNLELLKTQKPHEYETVKQDNGGNDLVEIVEGSNIGYFDGNQVQFVPVQNLRFEGRENFTVYRLSVSGDKTYIAENYVAHNK